VCLLETMMARHSFRQRRGSPAPSSDLLFGLNPVLEVIRTSSSLVEKLYVVHGLQVAERIAAEAQSHGIVVDVIDRQALDTMTGGGHHQGVAARTKSFGFVSIEDVLTRAPPIVTVLDGIEDPQNLGAIIRAGEVLGAGAVVLPKDRSVGVTPAVIRASSGAAIHVPVVQVVNLVRGIRQLKAAGYWIVGLDGQGKSKFQDLPTFERVALVVGSEGSGMRRLVARSCDFVVAIPVRGKVASLNAATAAAIGLHEMASRLVSSAPQSR
jgi:23S rRNA (guanosine2251-2'-O)-methyltransferase